MKTAKEIAEYLYNLFSNNGDLNSSCSSTYVNEGLTPASSENTVNWELNNIGFANKIIQAIGYENTQINSEIKPAVYIYVSKGITKKEEHIDYEIQGCPIKFRRLSSISVKPDNAQFTTNKPLLFTLPNGEMTCGSSCSLSTQNLVGTMGALIKFANNNTIYLLSNNHVIGGCNHAQKNAIITMPAPKDSGIGTAPYEVGRLLKVIPLSSGNPDFVEPCEIDAAIGEVTYPTRVTSWQGTITEGYDSPAKIIPLTSGMRVKKFGRTTGLTHGTIETKIVGCTKIPYKVEGFNAIVYFKGFWLVHGDNDNPFALAGDSGSLVVTEDENATVGLIFATSNSYACVIPIKTILDGLGGAQIVTRYRIPKTSG